MKSRKIALKSHGILLQHASQPVFESKKKGSNNEKKIKKKSSPTQPSQLLRHSLYHLGS